MSERAEALKELGRRLAACRRQAGLEPDLVVRARRLFGLSFSAMAWHLYNLRYFKARETVEALLALPDGEPLAGFEEDTRFDGLERRVLQAYAQEAISASRARELLGHSVEELTATLPASA